MTAVGCEEEIGDSILEAGDHSCACCASEWSSIRDGETDCELGSDWRYLKTAAQTTEWTGSLRELISRQFRWEKTHDRGSNSVPRIALAQRGRHSLAARADGYCLEGCGQAVDEVEFPSQRNALVLTFVIKINSPGQEISTVKQASSCPTLGD